MGNHLLVDDTAELINCRIIGLEHYSDPTLPRSSRSTGTLWESELNEQMNALKNKETVDPQRLVTIYLILGDREKAMEWPKNITNKMRITGLRCMTFNPLSLFPDISGRPRKECLSHHPYFPYYRRRP